MNIHMSEKDVSRLVNTLTFQLRSMIQENRNLRGQIEQLRRENKCQREDVRFLSDKYDEMARAVEAGAIMEGLQHVSET